MGICARRQGIDLKGSRVRVRKEMIADPLRRVRRMEVVFDLPDHVDPARRPTLEKAAHACPVERSLHPDVQVEMIFRYGPV
jgi:putative redox protein